MNSQSRTITSAPARSTIQITTRAYIPSPAQSRPCVLVIDADPVFAQLINHALARDYVVLTAHDAVEAAAKLRRGRIEMLLLDLSTPLSSGTDLLYRIRRHPRLREIPVLVLCTSPGLRRHLLDMDTVGVVPHVRWLQDLALTLGETLRLAGESSQAARPPLSQPGKTGREAARLI